MRSLAQVVLVQFLRIIRRLKDFQLKTMIASALDPRTKKMVTKVNTSTCSTHQPSRPSLAWRRCVPLSPQQPEMA